jgi:Ca2+/H+ antiporter, TMEM165/GDT1 family
MLEAFLVSTGVVALSEMGDKTQLLALVLAARFKRPWPIIAGIFVATLLNHAVAGAVGAWLASLVTPATLRWILGVSFIAMAAWMLVPDKPDERAGQSAGANGIFWTTLVLFFLIEIGDKTQIATVALAARFESLVAVVAGTTVGMLLANAPAVWFGERLVKKVPVRAMNRVAAALFLVMGVLVIVLH